MKAVAWTRWVTLTSEFSELYEFALWKTLFGKWHEYIYNLVKYISIPIHLFIYTILERRKSVYIQTIRNKWIIICWSNVPWSHKKTNQFSLYKGNNAPYPCYFTRQYLNKVYKTAKPNSNIQDFILLTLISHKKGLYLLMLNINMIILSIDKTQIIFLVLFMEYNCLTNLIDRQFQLRC